MDLGLGRWFRGLRGVQRRTGPPAKAAPNLPVPKAVTTARTPDPAPAAHEGDTREPSETDLAMRQTLRRTLEGRCDVLMRAAGADTRHSDAPMVIQRLRRLDETAIRQPPIAAQRVLALAKNPSTSSAQMVSILEQDPALTEALLQMANSTYYHRGDTACIAISDGIQRVGLRGVESIVTTQMVQGLLCRPGSAYTTMLSQVWAHMTRTASIARALAPAFGADPEVAFTIGLLHDVGKLTMFDYLSQLRAQYRRELDLPGRFLLDMLNRLHEPFGGIAALRWNFGSAVAQSIASHHREPPPGSPDLLSELLCVSERAEHSVRLGKPFDVWETFRNCELSTEPLPVVQLIARLPGVILSGPDGGKTRTTRAAA